MRRSLLASPGAACTNSIVVPSAKWTPPSGNSAALIFGPGRSASTPTTLPSRSAASRTRAIRATVSASAPCESERRAMFIPAAIIARIVCSSSDAGPTVATIFVRRSISPTLTAAGNVNFRLGPSPAVRRWRVVSSQGKGVRRRSWGLAPYALALVTSGVMSARMSTNVGGTRVVPLFDDAMISMTYARNLVHGHGVVFNAGGPKVEGYTNLLWTLAMAAVHALPLPTRLTSIVVVVLGVVCVVATVWLAGRVVQLIAPDSVAVALVRWFVAAAYGLVFWSTIGVEVGLVALLCLGATYFVLRFAAVPQLRDALLAEV